MNRILHKVGERLSNRISFSQDIVAADVHGELRVTQVYRREDGEWKEVHRHGDAVIEQES